MSEYFDGLLSNTVVLCEKDKDAFLKLAGKLREISLIFKEAGLNQPTTRADCKTDADPGNGGSCETASCGTWSTGGSCGTNSCDVGSNGGTCGTNVCGSNA